MFTHIQCLLLKNVSSLIKIFVIFPHLVNLPPTLSKSQVSSVRKNLKLKMLSLLKHPTSYMYQIRITTLLTDLGATQSEVKYD